MVAAAGLASTALLLTALPGGLARAASAGTSADGSFSVSAQGSSGTGKPRPLKTVTLVTGDQVMMDGAGKVTGVVRAKGRERMPFSVREIDGHTHVVPGDAELLLARGKLDSRLFDVTQLVADGYDDAGRGDLPLIVTFKGKKAPAMSPFTGAGAKMGRALPVVNGKAMRPVKKRGAEFWDAVTDTAAKGDARTTAGFTASTAVEKVWLDGRRRASLDKSVPQIGASTAWAAGYDGTGVKVAVLDTGVDKTHPDLASQVIAEQDFSGSSGPGDKFGHGTHVASIMAGTGAKSGGKYKGVAPGAKILNGKVLDDGGWGPDSGVIAGMEWAVAQGADVVNLSLGYTDTHGIDPLEETVNRLSAESDTLFVIAAGNEGASEQTVGSPGSAEAALTVGAVDKSDQLGDFSSRGPRVGDGGVKPDLTAPGVDITAAAAAGSDLEASKPSPVPGYITIGGTSMATPHVAGAAAILAQQHPDWTGERIKSVLTASAKPGSYSSFQQGTGRTDLVRALAQGVVTEQGPINFGSQQWPHNDDEPVTKQLTYKNFGTEPVTLDLSVDAFSVDGKPTAEGMFSVSPQRLTVPAGGEASANVTADTRSGSADGTFGGSVSAVSADDKVAVRTAVGVQREVESFDLTLKHIDENGKPTSDAVTTVEGLDRDFYTRYAAEEDGELTVRLPKGDYGLTGVIHPDSTSSAQAVLMQPRLRLDQDTTVTVDPRQAQPLDITVPDAAAKNTEATVAIRYERAAGMPKNTSGYWLPTFQGMRFGQLGPEVPADTGFAQYSGDWTTQDDEGRPVTYHLSWDRRGDLGGFAAKVEQNQLAKVDFQAGAPAADKDVLVAVSPHMPDGDLWGRYDLLRGDLPLRTTDYILDNGVKWSFAMQQYSAEGASEYQLQGTPRTWQAGQSYTERFNVGVFGPALGGAAGSMGSVAMGNPGVERSGNVITALLPLFGDGAGHYDSGGGYASAESSLQADGEEIPHSSSPADSITEFTVPDEARAYKLTLDNSRDPGLSPVSTRVRAEWTFRSAGVPEDETTDLPLSVVRFSPELSLDSTAKAGERFDVPFTVEGASAGRQPAKLAFEVSYDEGATWQTAEAVDGTHLSLRHPAEPGSVSLRAELTDDSGNTLLQTIERAYLTAG
ncbi:S8 family peptidase [Streptomyces sp. DSM 40750]|uniref:S8 family peptidase n=1 Tax=Streptomyces sp. DSM 40750 TaxID=2801030 RepID=UPI00214CEE4B|nr:S8 family serine peptidase [Streptomyces sp. DSM 40750]UUU23767.1 S8 family serine peptidase [Streptomyces sp. DSM 40750]